MGLWAKSIMRLWRHRPAIVPARPKEASKIPIANQVVSQLQRGSTGLIKSQGLSLPRELKPLWERHMAKNKPKLIAKSGIQKSSICLKRKAHRPLRGDLPLSLLLLWSRGMCRVGLAGQPTSALRLGPWDRRQETGWALAHGSQLWIWLSAAATQPQCSSPLFFSFSPRKRPPPCSVVTNSSCTARYQQ